MICRETKALARAGLRNPATVSVAVRSRAGVGGEGTGGQRTQATPSSLENFYVMCEPEEKLAQLVGFLQVGALVVGCYTYKVVEGKVVRKGNPIKYCEVGENEACVPSTANT